MGQKIATGSTSWECCWFYVEKRETLMCSFVLSYISGAAGVQLSTSSARRSVTPAVSTATKHEVCCGARATVGEETFTASTHTHTHTRRPFVGREPPPTPLFVLLHRFIVPVSQGEETHPRLQSGTHLAFLACGLVITLRCLFKLTSACFGDILFPPPT